MTSYFPSHNVYVGLFDYSKSNLCIALTPLFHTPFHESNQVQYPSSLCFKHLWYIEPPIKTARNNSEKNMERGEKYNPTKNLFDST